jgi:hypothetical protein
MASGGVGSAQVPQWEREVPVVRDRGRVRPDQCHLARTLALGAETLALPLRPPHPVGAPRQLGLDFPEPQRIHFTLSRFDNGAETLSRPMCAEGVL